MSNDISDTIVTTIIDKLISKVCRDEIIKEINSNFNNHCNDFISKLISPYLNTSFLFHENGLDIKDNTLNNIFYKSKLPAKINTWVSFTEPNSSIIDRHASNNNKLSKNFDIKNEKIKRKSIQSIQNNITNVVNEQKEIEKEKNKKIKKEKIKIKLKDIWKKDNNKILKNNFKDNLSLNKINKNKNIKKEKINDDKNEKEAETEKEKEKEKEIILEIPGTYIPYEKHERINIMLNNTEENDLLRKEKELEIIEKEELLKNERNKKLKPKYNFLMNKKFNNDKLTFDSNGNIIRLRLPHVNSFNKDFILSIPKINQINDDLNTDRIDRIDKIERIDKNDIFKKQKNTIKNNTKILNLINKELKIETNNNNKKTNLNSENNKEIKIEYNPNDKMDEYFIKSSNKNINTNTNTNGLIYSGPNFDKMSPEVGVIISNNDIDKSLINNKKIGGFEYIKKYNRPSMNEISSLLLSQNSKINNNKLTSFFNYDYSQNDININENEYGNKFNEKNNFELNQFNTDTDNNNNNYIGYKEKFNENNPLFQGAHHIKDEIKIKSYNKSKLLIPLKIKNKKSFSNENIFLSKKNSNKNTKMKKNISYHINPLYNNKNILINNKLSTLDINQNNNNYLSSFNTILLSDNFNSPNLKSIFMDDKENNIISNENKNNLINLKFNSIDYENDNGNINIISSLKDLKNRKNKLPHITENNKKEKEIIKQKYINEFNFDIIKNKNWGWDNIGRININKNSYKEQYLSKRNKIIIPNNIKITNNKGIKMEKFKQRNLSNLNF